MWRPPQSVKIQNCQNHDPGGRVGPQWGQMFELE